MPLAESELKLAFQLLCHIRYTWRYTRICSWCCSSIEASLATARWDSGSCQGSIRDVGNVQVGIARNASLPIGGFSVLSTPSEFEPRNICQSPLISHSKRNLQQLKSVSSPVMKCADLRRTFCGIGCDWRVCNSPVATRLTRRHSACSQTPCSCVILCQAQISFVRVWLTAAEQRDGGRGSGFMLGQDVVTSYTRTHCSVISGSYHYRQI